jgi:uncharacterized protein
MIIISSYAAVLVLLFVFLSARIIRLRIANRISIGDSGNSQLQRAIRVHSNFSEYVPIALILAFLAQAQGASGYFLHLVCLSLVLGRFVHAYGFGKQKESLKIRTAGMVLTFSSIVMSSCYLLFFNVYVVLVE